MADQEALFPEVLAPVREAAKPNDGNGRPRGSRNHKHKILQRIAQAHAVPLIESVIAAAEAGDMLAAKIVLDRIWPRPRTAPITIDLPETATPAELKTAMHQVLGRIASGELTTDDGAALVATMKDIITAYALDARAPAASAPGLLVAGEDAREVLAAKVARLLAARDQAPEPAAVEPEPAA
jgi:hypothetical protein